MKHLIFIFSTLCLFFSGNIVLADSFEIPADFGKVCERDSTGYCIELREPLGGVNVEGGGAVQSIRGETGLDLIGFYITILYQYGAALIGIVCVFIIVISGIQIIAGGANAEMVTQAKNRIMQSLLSLALLFLSAVILKTINPEFFSPMAVLLQTQFLV